MIIFLGNFQMNNFNEIFQFLILLSKDIDRNHVAIVTSHLVMEMAHHLSNCLIAFMKQRPVTLVVCKPSDRQIRSKLGGLKMNLI
ncbi:hypothetical protein EUGRSUZ_F02564 [Eucalyptus grandis]|uniref:Uncharacterized protein n=2 Tax=Eucalyptus grandis TaxID=71139 RepID=A0ACC3KK09_EUCGR|nr:hypothetical protein EUGRSUZ_F02564 [Eucalyptus grandis]